MIRVYQQGMNGEEVIKNFNEGNSTWKGKRIKDMTRNELEKAFDELGKLYFDSLKSNYYE